jgi:signal transduction histidine kinase
MIIPLVNRDRLVGLLTMSNRERGVFTERHAGLALAIATHIAAALENARLYDQTDQRAHELATLLEVSTGLGTTLELEPLLDVILEQLKVVADYRAAAISIVEDDRLHELRRRTREGDIPPTREVSLVHAAGWWHTVARGEPVIIGDVQSEESLAEAYRTTARHAQNATPVYVIHSFMAVPLTAQDRVMGTIVLSHEQPGFYTERHAALATAIAAQAAAAIENARLHAQTERRTHELSTLLDISRTLSSTLELEPLLGLILDQLRMVVDYTSATAITREGGCYLMREYRGQLPRDEVLSRSLPVDAVDNLIGLTPQGTALIIPDVWADTPAAEAYRATGSEEYLRTAPSYVGCLLNAPLIYKGRLIGLLTLGHRTPGHFTEHHAALTQAVADQVAGLIEHARLFEQEQRTSQELATLLEVARAVASTLDLSLLFDLVLEQLKTVVDYRGATLGTIDGDELLIVASHAVTPERSADRGLRFPLRRFGPIWEAIRRGQPAIIADVRGDEPAAVEYRALNAATMDGPTHRDIRSWMAVPLALGDRVIGMLSASQDVPDYFTPHHAELALAFANQVAVAVENARLFAESQGKAALEERQRLARELHDSVSQALFGIALGAGAARRRLDLDPSRVAESLDYVLSLADVALTEMRALIFELRPEALEKDGLVAALTRHAAATRVRHEVTVETVFCEEPDVPLATKEALYRIAQEAMHNAVKHARASRIDVTLSSTSTSISVEVNDDGVGFDPSQDFAGHLGLHSMRERMAVVGGTTDITSAPGQGACIRATAPAR